MMEILVTGGAGFIGGHLAEQFCADGHDVTVLDNLDPYYAEGIKQRNVEAASDATTDGGTYRFVEGDIREEATVTRLVENAEYVFHQAAQAGVRADIPPRKYHEVNVDGTLNVLDAVRDSDVTRLVLASSSSVYGEPQYLPYDETHPTRPVSTYGASKLAAERYAMVYAARFDVPAVALRYFTVYGPRMRPNMAISNFVSRCLNDEPPVVYGDGSQTRDFTHVEDVIDVNRRLLHTDRADGEVLNVGSTDRITIEKLASEITRQLAPELEPTHVSGYEIDADHTHADVGKAEELLDYEPSYTIRDGIAAFVDWYRANRDWYEPLVLDSD